MKKIKIGIITFEHMHALSYTTALSNISEVEIVGIFDFDSYRGTEMAARFNTKYYDSAKELFNRKLDGVVICSNNRDHVKYVEMAVEYNVPFIVEKPLANSFENGQKIVEMTERKNIRGMMAFPLRFNPSIRAAKAMIDSGEIGDIVSITGINHGKIPSGWFLNKELSGGGAIIDHTVHVADLIRWFTGKEFKQVFAEGGELLHHKNIDDTGIVLATLENNCKVSIDCSWAHRKNYPIWPQVDLDIVGTKGNISVKGFSLTQKIINETNNTHEDIMWGEDGDGEMIKAFVNLCKENPIPSDIPLVNDGFKALEVALGAYSSIEKKREIQLGDR